jgi:hypothetical protein
MDLPPSSNKALERLPDNAILSWREETGAVEPTTCPWTILGSWGRRSLGPPAGLGESPVRFAAGPTAVCSENESTDSPGALATY